MPKCPIQIPEELREIAPSYLESRKRDLAALKDALTRKDFHFIVGLAHKTKGTAGGYGFDELSRIAKSLETAANTQNPDDTRAALETMERHLTDIEIVY